MKRLIKKLTAIITFCIVILTTSGIVNAAGTGSLTIKITPDAIKILICAQIDNDQIHNILPSSETTQEQHFTLQYATCHY